ncbi:MAG: hypothetical protein GTO02_04570, partial [Candidatus Dadabacteria bacterium]|nr:hypothetical protein [Candidatus Dadabacteria bacterium]NIQ13689.1 hypothetical protein [Candidatus Dadabacteria bacterium]
MKPIYFMIVMLMILVFPVKGFTGGLCGINSDIDPPQLSAPYDLRNRKSYIQVTNTSPDPVTIHVQIFQHDRGCDELNFNDTLTPNDTVVYDMDNIVKNNGDEAPITLLDDSSGYVVVSDTDGFGGSTLIGNFRIIDDAGYEYRTNMAGAGGIATYDITN